MIRGLLLVATCTAGCIPTAYPPLSLPSPCEQGLPRVDGRTFVGPVERGGTPFSLLLPNGFEPVSVMGIDSEVKGWVDPAGNSVGYDYGASISQPHLRSHLAHYAECQDTIGGRLAVIALGHDTAGTMASVQRVPKFVAVATWRMLDGGPHMSVIVTSRDAAGLGRGLAVLRSVRFPLPPAPPDHVPDDAPTAVPPPM
jgi:hypothetical protein